MDHEPGQQIERQRVNFVRGGMLSDEQILPTEGTPLVDAPEEEQYNNPDNFDISVPEAEPEDIFGWGTMEH